MDVNISIVNYGFDNPIFTHGNDKVAFVGSDNTGLRERADKWFRDMYGNDHKVDTTTEGELLSRFVG